jgi:PAS domain S-box-containing protein
VKRIKTGAAADRLDYGRIFHDMSVGFTLLEMLFDGEGRPIDFRFIDANPAYERITGLRIGDIRGKRVREVLPEIEERWIEAYGRVVLTGEPALFTDYSKDLGKHFEVWAYRPEPGRFVVMVRDVTGKVAIEATALRQASILRAVLGSVDSAVAFKGLDGRYLGCNLEYERAFGLGEDDIVGRSDAEIFDPAKAAWIEAADRKVLESGSPMPPSRVWLKDSAGRERLYELRKLPLAAEGGEVFGIAIFWHDISDAILAEKADSIHIALARVEDTATSADILSKAVDELESATGSELGFFSCVEGGSRSLGLQAWSTRTERGACRLPRSERHGPLGIAGLWADCVRSRLPIVLEGADLSSEGRIPPLGHTPLLRVLILPVIREEEVVGLLGIANKSSPYNDWDLALSVRVADSVWEVFERKRAQERVRDIAIERDLAISAMRAGLETWYIDEGRKVYDERWAAILGYSLSELPADSMDTARQLTHPDDFAIAEERLRLYLSGRRESFEAELRMRHKDGRWIWVLDRAQIALRGSDGEPLRLSGLIIDISDLKEAEEGLRAGLREKDILLQELFHRTKNSMQLINAMLELKKQGLESSPFNLAIETVQSKIIAMSLVQEKLYRGGDLSVLDLGGYIAELVELIKAGEPVLPPNVTIKSETMNVPVSVDAAIPCGLIVSELISNALVHAFPGGAPGSIDVSVSRSEDEISISVRDDGVGLPEGYDLRKGSRLGLRTVLGIGEEQLHGRMEFGSAARGFSCRLTFKDVYYPRRL